MTEAEGGSRDPRRPAAAADSRPGRLPVHDRAAAGVAAGLAGGGDQGAGDRRSALFHRRPARSPATTIPTPASLYRAGTVGMIMRMRKLSDGGLKVLVQGLCRARIQRFIVRAALLPRAPRAHRGRAARPRSVSVEALLRSVRQNVDKLSALGKTIQPELAMVVQSVDDPGRMADLVASNLTLKVPEAQALLELDEPVERLTRVNQTLEKEIGILEVQSQIQSSARRRCRRPSATTSCASSCGRSERAGRRRRPRRGDRGAARRRSSAPGCPTRRAPRPTSSCGGWSR